MQTIYLETTIAAPAERCFLLSLSLDLHVASTSATQEQAIAGVTHGIIGPNETVTWRGRHFGLWLTHKTRITGYRRPEWFQDSMEEGLFHSFIHDHHFAAEASNVTTMRDTLQFAAPLGPLGWLAEVIALRSHLTKFLRQRNEVIKRIAESSEREWAAYVS